MLDSGFISELLAAIFFIFVGIRLFLLSRRTGEAPEKLLGIYFFVTGWAYISWLVIAKSQLDSGTAALADLTTWVLYSLGVTPFIFFTRLVFRPNAVWAKWLTAANALLLFSGVAMWIVQRYDHYVLDNPWFWVQWLGYTTPCVWVGIEAFLSHSSANRRARVGLCDRVVANRYLLFGSFGVFQTFACISDVYLVPGYATNHGVDLVLGTLETMGALMLFLVFFPPAFYQRWISASATSAAETVEG
jgi:hypothetical protein